MTTIKINVIMVVKTQTNHHEPNHFRTDPVWCADLLVHWQMPGRSGQKLAQSTNVGVSCGELAPEQALRNVEFWIRAGATL